MPLPIPEADLIDLPVPPFTVDEARTYLVEKLRLAERLAPTPGVIDAVIFRAEGVPLKLALYAEILEGDPGLTADAILTDPNAEVAYLIRRVVRRLPDPHLRLVLRYGSAFKSLTFDVVRAGIVPNWEGLLEADTLRKGLSDDLAAENAFSKPDAPPADVDDLWRKLARYVARASWINPASGEAGEEDRAFQLHSDVINPMRFLLQKEDKGVLALLHGGDRPLPGPGRARDRQRR
ncbi:MAG: hypothetical protein WKF75_05045 [Singulisphaera sp.]